MVGAQDPFFPQGRERKKKKEKRKKSFLIFVDLALEERISLSEGRRKESTPR